jgi:hypothetical protein
MNTQPISKFVSIKDVPQYIQGITTYRIRQLCKQGKIRYNKAGNRYIINLDWLIEDLEIMAFKNLQTNKEDIAYGKLRKIEISRERGGRDNG